jgi:hypothetical protein
MQDDRSGDRRRDTLFCGPSMMQRSGQQQQQEQKRPQRRAKSSNPANLQGLWNERNDRLLRSPPYGRCGVCGAASDGKRSECRIAPVQ